MSKPRKTDRTPVSITYRVQQVLSVRNSLVEILQAEYGGSAVKGKGFDRFIRIVREALPSPYIDMEALADSLRHLAGVPLTDDVLKENCHRIAGNVYRLRHGRAVFPWKVQRFPEWVPIQIMGSRLERSKRGKLGVMLALKIMAGTPCPLIVMQWWSRRQCQFYAPEFGFTKLHGKRDLVPPKYPFSDSAQLVTLRFLGLIDPERSAEEPYVAKIKTAPTIATWNKEQLKLRFRIDAGYNCPQNYPTTHPCHRCRFGYDESCPAAVHCYDYFEKDCPVCGTKKALWDPELPATMCVNCFTDQVISRKVLQGG